MSKRKTIEPILVITIQDGVVNEAKLFSSTNLAEKNFIKKALDFGACENDLVNRKDMDSHLDDGYYQGSNETVCLVHPEVI